APPVDLDPAAQDDRLERPTLGDRAEDRDHRVVGEAAGGVRGGPRVRFPHCEMDQHMGVETGHFADDAIVLTSDDTMEHRSPQPCSRWIGVDTLERSHPGLGFEQAGERRSELAAHPAYERPHTSHDPSRYPGGHTPNPIWSC